MKIYAANIAPLYENEIFRKYCDSVDSVRLSQVLRTGTRDGKVRSLVAGYLLQTGVREQLEEQTGSSVSKWDPIPLSYSYGVNGKPAFAQREGKICRQLSVTWDRLLQPHFNLSHSGRYVACGFHGEEIGVDIQEQSDCRPGVAKRFFTGEECALLQACGTEQARVELFFQMWTVKESYIKLTGWGMKQGLDTFQIDWKEQCIREKGGEIQAYFWQQTYGENYRICVCTRKRQEKLCIKTIRL